MPTPTLSGIGAEAPGGTRAPFLPTANLPLGNTVQLDGRLTKNFPIREKDSVALSFEAINALNHIRNTGVVQLAYKSTWNTATETGTLTSSRFAGLPAWMRGPLLPASPTAPMPAARRHRSALSFNSPANRCRTGEAAACPAVKLVRREIVRI